LQGKRGESRTAIVAERSERKRDLMTYSQGFRQARRGKGVGSEKLSRNLAVFFCQGGAHRPSPRARNRESSGRSTMRGESVALETDARVGKGKLSSMRQKKTEKS